MSKTKGFSKVLALVIMLALVIGILPMGVMATSYTCNGVTVQFGDPNATATWPESAMTLTRRGTTNVWDANYTGGDNSDYYPSVLSLYAFMTSNDYITLEASNSKVRFVTYNNAVPTVHTSIKYSTNQNTNSNGVLESSNLFVVKLTGAGNVLIKDTSTSALIATICFSAPKSARADGTTPSAVCGYLPIGQFARSNSFGWGTIFTDATNVWGANKTPKFTTAGNGYTATGVSLGMLGGYVQFELATALNEDATRPYGIDFIVYGNPFVGNPEAGSVKVYGKVGGTYGWYNLAGSRHYQSGTDKHMNVSYVRLKAANTSLDPAFNAAGIYYSTDYAVPTGSTTVNSAISAATWQPIPKDGTPGPASQAWWPEKANSENYEQVWKMWKSANGATYDGDVDGVYWDTSATNSNIQVITYQGVVRLEDDDVALANCTPAPTSADHTDYYRFGYADVRENGTHYGKAINPYATLPSAGKQSAADGTTNCGGDGFDLSWAVDQYGNPVQVTDVTKIRVYSSVLYNAGVFGETSTEVCGLYIASGTGDGANNGTISLWKAYASSATPMNANSITNVTAGTYYLNSNDSYVYINGAPVTDANTIDGHEIVIAVGQCVQIISQSGTRSPFITVLKGVN